MGTVGEKIASVEITSFRPIRDFGGWGIRFGKEATAYFMSGNRGVLITGSFHRKYILGSDTPERLKSVIQYAVAKENQDEEESNQMT